MDWKRNIGLPRYFFRIQHDFLYPEKVKKDMQKWWGSSGSEEIDKIDPKCQSEEGMLIGPFTPEEVARFYEKAASIPGWTTNLIQLWVEDRQRKFMLADVWHSLWTAFERKENGKSIHSNTQ